MRVIGHRGASADAPENSLAAFRLAAAQGADGVECDLRLSADGVIVLSHDDVLTRSRGVAVKTGETTATNLATHDVPTLTAMLAAMRGQVSIINLELKEPIPAELLAATIGPDTEGIVLSCFDTVIVARTYAALPHIPFWYLSIHGTADAIHEATQLGCAALHTRYTAVTAEYCALAATAHLPVYVWSLNDPVRARILEEYGVVGITTDVPAHMRAAFPKI